MCDSSFNIITDNKLVVPSRRKVSQDHESI